MYHIIDNVYLSNRHDAYNMKLIEQNQIKMVIRLSEDYNVTIYPPSIQFCNFELEDNPLYKKEIIEYSKEIYNLVINNKEKIY